MKVPISPLPWYRPKHTIHSINDSNSINCIYDDTLKEDDVEYIVQACNAFPKAIELLEIAAELLNVNTHAVIEAQSQINEFLTKLKENEA